MLTTLLPDCEHSQNRSAHRRPIDKTRRKRRLLPSPSTSSSICHEVGKTRKDEGHSYLTRLQQIYPLAEPNAKDLPKASHSAPETSVAYLHSHCDLTDLTPCSQGRKRKRSWVGEEVHKHRKSEQVVDTTASTFHASNLTRTGDCCKGKEDDDDVVHTASEAIVHWARFSQWPKDFASMNQESKTPSKKRQSISSYTQSYKDGEVPKAHSAAHEKHFAEHGLFMEELKGRSQVHEDSKSLCTNFLLSTHPGPQHTTFPLSQFLLVWQRLQTRNEAKLYRDITPLLVPSPELLWICGGHDELEHVVDEISVEWTKCKLLGGPRPKPDLAVGITPSAFSDEEMAKLRNHQSFERPTMFTDNMYFPFLLCEAKCTNEGIDRADRQNMHSSSIAVNAILQLHQAVDESKARELSGQILVFSVSHDNRRVNLYGHFAVVESEKTSFYRYPITVFNLNFDEGLGWKRTYDFVREVYHEFYPAHLKRIQNALAAMERPRALSTTVDMSVDESEQDPSALSSQEPGAFKKPRQPASKKQKSELALLREQLAEQQRQSKEQMALLERQMTEQQRQSKEQAEQYKEQIALLKQLLELR